MAYDNLQRLKANAASENNGGVYAIKYFFTPYCTFKLTAYNNGKFSIETLLDVTDNGYTPITSVEEIKNLVLREKINSLLNSDIGQPIGYPKVGTDRYSLRITPDAMFHVLDKDSGVWYNYPVELMTRELPSNMESERLDALLFARKAMVNL